VTVTALEVFGWIHVDTDSLGWNLSLQELLTQQLILLRFTDGFNG
jgi:hypothetical protein